MNLLPRDPIDGPAPTPPPVGLHTNRESVRRGRLIQGSALLSMSACLLLGLLEMYLGSYRLSALAFLMFITSGAALSLATRDTGRDISGPLLLWAALPIMTLYIYLQGGTFEGAWFPVLLVAAPLLLSRRLARVYALLVLASIAGLELWWTAVGASWWDDLRRFAVHGISAGLVFGLSELAEERRVRSLRLASRMAEEARDQHDTTLRAQLALQLQAQALARSNADLERVSQARNAFLARVSHELRTPLHGVLGMADLLKSTQLSDEQALFTGALQDSGRSLLVLIDEILDSARIEAERFSLNESLHALDRPIRHVYRTLRALASQRGLRLEYEIDDALPEAALGDPVRLTQVLMNLVGNALKFTERGSVRIRLTRPTLDRVRYEVIDTGPGIPSAELPKLFEPFAQLDGSPSREFGGAGLGLTISRGLIERMGGELRADSMEGEGSTFWFELPLRTSLAAPDPIEPARPPTPTGPPGWSGRVLVVEDNPINQLVIQRKLELLGLEPVLVDGGRQALELLSTDADYALVLMDFHMPGMDGLETTRRVRSAHGRSLPIVALSAAATPEDQRRCLASGMDAFLSKPIEEPALLELLDRYLPAKREVAAR